VMCTFIVVLRLVKVLYIRSCCG